MATGQSMQLAKQIGEYLTAAELCRRKFVAATFSGNVPHYDILASDENGKKIAVQVKTIRGGSWQFDARKFVNITMSGNKQVLGVEKKEPYPNLLCVFILIDNYGSDKFYIFTWKQLQDIMIYRYKRWLDKHDGKRPRKPDSFHSSLNPEDLKKHEDNWDILFT
ncbi:hypothetical protein ES705_29761 [subsurface metagenome]